MSVHNCVSRRKAIMLVRRAFVMGLNECSRREVEDLLVEKGLLKR